MCGNRNNNRLSRFVDTAVDNITICSTIHLHYNIMHIYYYVYIYIYRPDYRVYIVYEGFGNLLFEYLFLICQPK